MFSSSGLRRSVRPLALLGLVPVRVRIIAIAMGVVESCLPPAVAFSFGSLVERSSTGGPLVVAAATLVALLAVQQLSEIAIAPIRERVAREIDGRFRRSVGALALSPVGVSHLDDPVVADLIGRATSEVNGFTPGRASAAQVVVISQVAAALGCLVLLSFRAPLAALAMLVLLVLARVSTTRVLVRLNDVVVRAGALAGRADYWRRLATGIEGAKEVRVFGLAEWVVDRWRDRHTDRVRTVSRARARALVLAWLPLAPVGAAALVGLLAVVGVAEPGPVAQHVMAVFGALGLGAVSWDVFVLAHGRAPLDAYDRLRTVLPPAPAPEPFAPPTGGPPSIRFEDVAFAYGDGDPVLSGITLDVAPGEVVAVVGVNGAGKSTCVKLLQRLYEPDRGRITVDGVDLRDLDARAWRDRIAFVGQDFARLDLSLRDNVTLGAPERRHDDELFEAVAAEFDLADLVPADTGWDTPLSRGRTGGTDLSGGQWQRVALARALFAVRAGRQVLVLDEPTAHLDADAEFAVFHQVVTAMRGASIILVSHRLATVRFADRIAVFRDGVVSELGSHSDLIASPADYARMFDVQASPFAEDLS
ncbi:ATP-binding cassette subfamily B protein [Umezawaea tangerina]|uniref:ATP-binding cassette subfamily B protein n=1 Tax=Umezawaea tangerina TaxID=84725 RepID=A0A2T0T6M4_9PSEU|nr:ATP-binding cassette subfamily B protein [Umezawaea tangerina]